MMFPCQLPKQQKYALYKAIKNELVNKYCCYSYDLLKSAWDNKIKDLPYEVQRNSGLL